VKSARMFVIHDRLAKAAACLERLDEERVVLGDPNLGKSIEERIIWCGLLECVDPFASFVVGDHVFELRSGH